MALSFYVRQARHPAGSGAPSHPQRTPFEREIDLRKLPMAGEDHMRKIATLVLFFGGRKNSRIEMDKAG